MQLGISLGYEMRLQMLNKIFEKNVKANFSYSLKALTTK